MKSLREEIKQKSTGVKNMIQKLSVSSPELVKKLKARKFSSRGDGSGCENTHFTSVWDSWNDKK